MNPPQQPRWNHLSHDLKHQLATAQQNNNRSRASDLSVGIAMIAAVAPLHHETWCGQMLNTHAGLMP